MSQQARALLSVSDKTGLVDFAAGLVGLGFELVSTGGTATALQSSGLPVLTVERLTGFPEMLDGRVKTLHPAVHASLLADLRLPEHRGALEAAGLVPIAVVAVNLYPFARAAAAGLPEDEVIEQIDVGGPAMLRAAAKNWHNVTVVSDPARYPEVLEALRSGGGITAEALRRRLASEAFAHTAAYDARVAAWFQEHEPLAPGQLTLAGDLARQLRYGENPHQDAALYAWAGGPAAGWPAARHLQGEELGYNNLLDLDCALECAQALGEGGRGAAVLVKHATPCGAATALRMEDAFREARAADAESAFGGVVALAGPCDLATAQALAETFLEAVVATEFSSQAREALAAKPRLRVLEAGPKRAPARWSPRAVAGGFLVQSPDLTPPSEAWRVAGARPPSAEEDAALHFAWTISRFVRSNAIVLARLGPGGGCHSAGVGPGQTSRVESVRVAVRRAGAAGAAGSVLASDGFFPHPDGLEEAAAAGVTAVVQPGGSRKDPEVLAAADRLGLAMVITGARHFRH